MSTYLIQICIPIFRHEEIKASEGSLKLHWLAASEFGPFRNGNASVEASQERARIVPFAMKYWST
jgi:hypothetical protein